MTTIMKLKKYITIAFLTILATLSVSAQNQFEGIIELDMFNSGVQEQVSVKWYIKGGKHLMEYTGTAMDEQVNYQMVFLPGNSNAYMLSETNGTKMVYKIPNESMVKNIPDAYVASFDKTNDTKEMLGYSTTKYELTTQDGNTTYWIAEGTGLTIKDMPAVFKKRGDLKVLESNNIQGIPVQFVKKDKEGNILASQTIKSITATQVEDGLFDVETGRKTPEEIFETK